ncbi:MAG: anthranilate phosphoribosyltransferase [Eubacteriales bacterium]
MFREVMNKLIDKIDLTQEEMIGIMNEIMDGNVSQLRIAAFLTALRMKGETIEEIVGCAKVMRQKSIPIYIKDEYALDTCGTGGDGKHTFNVSTVAAIIAASAGVTTVKHGNRSVSSKCGSADVLEELGIQIDLDSKTIQDCIKKTNFGFLFAPKFHLSMKHVAPIRRELGVRTIFNVLGPLTNPAKVNTQIMGVYNEHLTEPIAEVLKQLGIKRACVLHSLDGMDEISIFEDTKVTELKDGRLETYYIQPKKFGFKEYPFKAVQGESPEENAIIILDILHGKRGAPRDIALINAAAAIYIGNGADNLQEGFEKAIYAVDSGNALDTFNALIAFTKGK